MGYFKIYLALFVIIAEIFLLNGCAARRNMAFTKSIEQIDISKESIAIFTLKTSNSYKPGCQPFADFVTIKSKNRADQDETYEYYTNLPTKAVQGTYNEYFLSVQMTPGEYILDTITGMVILYHMNGNCGSFDIPINATFKIEPDSLVYIGRIEADNVKRVNDDELRAGPVLPLLDQALSGYYTGTFRVKVYDNFDEDIASFANEFPAIKNQKIVKGILQKAISTEKPKEAVGQ
ncbi:MAG: hypothetical protein WC539_06505 [Nitrospirota bacterium]